MCGFVGVWHRGGGAVSRGALEQARDSMVARGPDDAGTWIDGSVGLAHRRLSIRDLTARGRMPMVHAGSGVQLVYNGELYGEGPLRERLRANGWDFRTTTDSEVILAAYVAYGPDFVDRIEGMFSFAIWDPRSREILLARDRAGQKPLYIGERNGTLSFGSSAKAVAALLGDVRADHEALAEYLRFGYVPAPRSAFVDVEKLPPGTTALFAREGAPRMRRYFDLREMAAEPRVEGEKAIREGLRGRLRAAVARRLVADVPVGAFLSGGVDSSLIVAMMAEAGRSDVTTYTIGFDDPKLDESARAQAIARALGVRNEVFRIGETEVLAELEGIEAILDEPLADPSLVPSRTVARIAREHCTVVLTGDGADELFGGYRYYAALGAFAAMPAAVRRGLGIGHRFPGVGERWRRGLARFSVEDAARFFGESGFYRGGTARLSEALIHSELRMREPVGARVARALREVDSGQDPVGAALLQDSLTTLPDAWLMKVDRATMSASLEARSPFLDQSILSYAHQIPSALRVRGRTTKWVLKDLLEQYLPRELVHRPKQGFAPPYVGWLEGPLRNELRDRVRDDSFLPELVDTGRLRGLLAEFEAGRRDLAQLFWAVLILERWRENALRQG